MEKIGVIAGRGNFPLLLASEAKLAGYDVTAICVKGNTRRQIKKFVLQTYWLDVTDFKKIPEIFKKEGISKVILAGQINPYLLFNSRVMSNPAVSEFFGKIEDCRADTVFKSFAKKLEEAGLVLLNSTLFLDKYIPSAGVLAKRSPSPEEQNDVKLGFKAAKHLGGIDIGQSVCVKNGIILAVESIEGTDNTVKRAKALSRREIVLVKASKPNQDARFDVPVVGLKTIKNLPKKSCLAIEAGKTLFVDKEKATALADKKDIAIIAVDFS